LDRRLGGPQNRSGRGGEEKNSQPLPGFETPIIQPTELQEVLKIRYDRVFPCLFFNSSFINTFRFKIPSNEVAKF
jgi:hypothetical protein